MTVLDWSARPAERLTINGVALEYACYGPAPEQAPTIVMLHEGLGSVSQWKDFPAEVARQSGQGVFVYSRQGYGNSDPVNRPRPLDFMTREATSVLPALLDRIGFKSGILLGHSDGATIASIYAGSVEDHRIRGLILIAPHFFTEPIGLAEIARAKQAFETGDLKQRLSRHHTDEDGAFLGWADAWLDPGFADWNVADSIDYLRIPALVVQGREDQYGTLAQVSEIETRSYAPVDTLILDDCRHAPHQDRPGDVLNAVGEFVARLERIEAATVETV